MYLCLILRRYAGAKAFSALTVPPAWYEAIEYRRALGTADRMASSRHKVVVFCHHCRPHWRRKCVDVRGARIGDREKLRALLGNQIVVAGRRAGSCASDGYFHKTGRRARRHWRTTEGQRMRWPRPPLVRWVWCMWRTFKKFA